MTRRVLIPSSHGSRTSRTCRKSMWCNRPTLPALWRFPLTSSRLSTWKLVNGVAFGKQLMCNINRCGLRKRGIQPPPLALPAFKDACSTFAAEVGLGWDKLHPRVLLRCSDSVLLLLIQIFMMAESIGCWFPQVGVVLVVLIPKPDGGRRPIGAVSWPHSHLDACQDAYLAWQLGSRPTLKSSPKPSGRNMLRLFWIWLRHSTRCPLMFLLSMALSCRAAFGFCDCASWPVPWRGCCLLRDVARNLSMPPGGLRLCRSLPLLSYGCS